MARAASILCLCTILVHVVAGSRSKMGDGHLTVDGGLSVGTISVHSVHNTFVAGNGEYLLNTSLPMSLGAEHKYHVTDSGSFDIKAAQQKYDGFKGKVVSATDMVVDKIGGLKLNKDQKKTADMLASAYSGIGSVMTMVAPFTGPAAPPCLQLVQPWALWAVLSRLCLLTHQKGKMQSLKQCGMKSRMLRTNWIQRWKDLVRQWRNCTKRWMLLSTSCTLW